jgi:hypothetical protein
MVLLLRMWSPGELKPPLESTPIRIRLCQGRRLGALLSPFFPGVDRRFPGVAPLLLA